MNAFATKVFAMSSLIPKAASLHWTKETPESFDDVKQALMYAPALTVPASEGRGFCWTPTPVPWEFLQSYIKNNNGMAERYSGLYSMEAML